MMLLLAMSPPPFFFFSCSPLSCWRQIGEPKTWQDCNVSERFALGCRSAPLTSTQQWRQRRLQFSTTVWGRLIMSEILHFFYKPIQVCKLAWKLITGWCCLGLRFPSQIYFTERARPPARSPAMKRSKYVRMMRIIWTQQPTRSTPFQVQRGFFNVTLALLRHVCWICVDLRKKVVEIVCTRNA